MDFLLYYCISTTLLWALYKVLLSQTTKLNLNRFLLLILPILPILIYWVVNNLNYIQPSTNTFIGQTIQEVTISSQQQTIASAYSIWDLITMIYLIGASAFLIHTFIQLFKTVKQIKSTPFTRLEDGTKLAYTENKNTFSFFNYIHISLDLKDNDSVLSHELVHTRQKHSIDVMIYQLYSIIFWFHPIIHLLNSEIKLLHEYIADDKVSNNTSKINYANNLLNIYFGTGSIQFINQFNNKKFIKMRLKMLSKNERKPQLWRYAAVPTLLAVLALSVSSFNTNSKTYASTSIQETNPVYDSVDVMPEYKGGMNELFTFIGANVKYPEQALADKVEGKCYVEFVITKTGDIKDAKVVKGVNDEIDAESLRVINMMPKWTPGIKDDKKVNVRMVLPIAYKLNL